MGRGEGGRGGGRDLPLFTVSLWCDAGDVWIRAVNSKVHQ